MRVLVSTTRPAEPGPRPAGRVVVKAGYQRAVAGTVDKVVEYRISPDALTAVAMGSARGADTVTSLGWRTLALLAVTLLVAVAGGRRSARARRALAPEQVPPWRPVRPAMLRRHPRRPPNRPLPPTTSRRPHPYRFRDPLSPRRRRTLAQRPNSPTSRIR